MATKKETAKINESSTNKTAKSKKSSMKKTEEKNNIQQIQLVVEKEKAKPSIKNNSKKATNVDPMQEFTEIVTTLIENARKLAMYDSFGSAAIISCIELMLSKSEQYVQQRNQEDMNNKCNCNDNNKVNPNNIPEEIKEDVDDIISKVRANLNK